MLGLRDDYTFDGVPRQGQVQDLRSHVHDSAKQRTSHSNCDELRWGGLGLACSAGAELLEFMAFAGIAGAVMRRSAWGRGSRRDALLIYRFGGGPFRQRRSSRELKQVLLIDACHHAGSGRRLRLSARLHSASAAPARVDSLFV